MSANPRQDAGLNAPQRARLADAPSVYRPLMRRAFSGKSKAAGIKSFCITCVGFVRADVRNCTAFGCPLWAYRPYQRDDEPDDASETT